MCDAPASAPDNRLNRSCRRRRDVANTYDEWGRDSPANAKMTAGEISDFFVTAKL
jgi:hypothetical protein